MKRCPFWLFMHKKTITFYPVGIFPVLSHKILAKWDSFFLKAKSLCSIDLSRKRGDYNFVMIKLYLVILL